MVPRGKACSDFRSLSYVWSLPRTCPFWFLSQFLTLDHLLPPDTLHSLFPPFVFYQTCFWCSRHSPSIGVVCAILFAIPEFANVGWCPVATYFDLVQSLSPFPQSAPSVDQSHESPTASFSSTENRDVGSWPNCLCFFQDWRGNLGNVVWLPRIWHFQDTLVVPQNNRGEYQKPEGVVIFPKAALEATCTRKDSEVAIVLWPLGHLGLLSPQAEVSDHLISCVDFPSPRGFLPINPSSTS